MTQRQPHNPSVPSFLRSGDEQKPAQTLELNEAAFVGEETVAVDPYIEPRVKVRHGYGPLFEELVSALNQSQDGKGRARHAPDGKPFLNQPLCQITRMVGPGGSAYQVMKKTQEAVRLAERGEYAAAVAELHGAIVYAAATAMIIKEKQGR